MKVVNHGDIILYPVSVKPVSTAKKAKLHVLQDSEVTGNRHEVVSKSFISRWIIKGKEFVHCPKDYEIRHVGGDCEHGVLPLEAGTYEVKHEMEHDPFKNELRIVLD